jgi:hypothetical protein
MVAIARAFRRRSCRSERCRRPCRRAMMAARRGFRSKTRPSDARLPQPSGQGGRGADPQRWAGAGGDGRSAAMAARIR